MMGTCRLADGQLGVCGSFQFCLEQRQKPTNIRGENWDVYTETIYCNYIETDKTKVAYQSIN